MSVTTKLKNKSVPHITEETTVLLPEYGFTAIETIGIGTFGAVFLVTDNKGNQYALKKVCLDPNFKNRELEIVSSLYHPNCLRYITHYITKEGSKNNQYLHLVTDYVPNSLSNFMTQFPFPPPMYVKLFGFQLFSGLCYLHSHGICHRDIKPSNVLVDYNDGRLQLCDFGSGKVLKSGESSVSYIATRSYRAPELLLGCSDYTVSVDIWAAGCVLAELFLCGKPLFIGENNNEMLISIAETIGNPKPEDLTSSNHTKKMTTLASKVIPIESRLRSFVSPEFLDLLSKIFVYNPKRRFTAAQCMTHLYFADLFVSDSEMPNQRRIPEWIMKMRTPEQMLRNFPKGP